MRASQIKIILLALCLAPLAACSPMVKDEQPNIVEQSVVLRAEESVGQTFTARDRGLNGIRIFLVPETAGTGAILMHLRADSLASQDIATAALEARTVNAPGYYRFEFAPQRDSREHGYYLLLNAETTGTFRVATAPGDMYLEGALYQNGNPVDAQLTFQLAYDPIELLVGLGSQTVVWAQIIFFAILLFVLPGWALLAWLLPSWSELSWGERLGLASGLSLTIYPVLLLWTALINLRLGSLYAWLPVVAAVAALGWRNRTWRLGKIGDAWREWRESDFARSDIALAALIALVVLTRFWVIRSLDLPMWGDSYQHTMIAQLMLDHRGLFDSWMPYSEITSFTYHFGFHAASAVFAWVSGLDTPHAVLWTGQILNALAVIGLYPLAVRIGGNRWAGVGAVLIAGLLAQMPMFYVNWGRYTQLAGQVILPGVICVLWALLEKENRDWRLIGLAWIALSGLALTHYRVLIFAIFFLPAFLLWQIRRARVLIARICLIGVGAGLLFLPWFIHIFSGKIATSFAVQLTTPAMAIPVAVQEYNAIGDVGGYLPLGLWLVAFASLIWGLWRRRHSIILLLVWSLLLLLAANPQWLLLPGEGAVSNFAVFIAAYIPVAVLIGSALSWFAMDWQSKRRVARVALAVAITALGLLGARERIRDLQIAQHTLVTRPDLRAANWIRQNTKSDARFLVNSFFAYGGSVIVGSDGGWWLPLIAHRQTTLPPINYASESGPRTDYLEWVNMLTTVIQKNGIASADGLTSLRERGVTHVYIGEQQGRVNYTGPYVLKPEQLLASAHFHPVYHQDRVWVFEIQ